MAHSRKLSAKQTYHSLCYLLSRSPKERKKILKEDKNLVRSLCDCAHNILFNKKIKLNSKHKVKLHRHKESLRLLADKKKPLKKKQTVLNQTGGFLGALLSTAVPLLGSLLGGLIHK